MTTKKETRAPNGGPENPGSLRERARVHRSIAAAEGNPERRRAYIFIAAEYERLADAIEREFPEPDWASPADS